MNLKDLKEIIEIFEQANITELDLERQGVKIRLKKGGERHGFPETRVEIQEEKIPSPHREKIKEKTVEIKAPMVGTFYGAASPDEEPFVKEKDNIKIGQVICIIEAMKLMNEIKSDYEGLIKKILVENGQPVEFDQALFIIEPK